MNESYACYLTKVLGIKQVICNGIQDNPHQLKVLFFEWSPTVDPHLQSEIKSQTSPIEILRNKMISAMQIASHEYTCSLQTGCSAEEALKRLAMQIEISAPEVVVVFGDDSASLLHGSETSVSQQRGQWHSWNQATYCVTYSPHHLLNHASDKKLAWEDLQGVMKFLGRAQ